jgi:hypothetical protein
MYNAPDVDSDNNDHMQDEKSGYRSKVLRKSRVISAFPWKIMKDIPMNQSKRSIGQWNCFNRTFKSEIIAFESREGYILQKYCFR